TDRIRDSIFWAQVERMRADRTWTVPAGGWSTYVPPPRPRAAPGPAQPPARPAGAGARPVPAPNRPDRRYTPEAHWRGIATWAKDALGRRGALAGPRPLAVAVENRTDWELAFGPAELGDILGEGPPHPEAIRPGPARDCRVVVTGLSPGEWIDVTLQ